MPKLREMTGVREHTEGDVVELWFDETTGRLVVRAYNEAGFNSTNVDLMDLVGWLRSGLAIDDREAGREETTLMSPEEWRRHLAEIGDDIRRWIEEGEACHREAGKRREASDGTADVGHAEDGKIRLRVLVAETGQAAWIDMPVDEAEALAAILLRHVAWARHGRSRRTCGRSGGLVEME